MWAYRVVPWSHGAIIECDFDADHVAIIKYILSPVGYRVFPSIVAVFVVTWEHISDKITKGAFEHFLN